MWWQAVGVAIFIVLVAMVILTFGCARVTINVGARDATQNAPVSLEDQDTFSAGNRREDEQKRKE